MLPFIVFVMAIALLVILGSLRYSKGIAPLRSAESGMLPGFPGPRGLIIRLDGMERKQRTIVKGSYPILHKDGSMALPEKWEEEMTVGRMAMVAHTWGMSQLAEENPEAVKVRERSINRVVIITIFAVLIAVALFFMKGISVKYCFTLIVGAWAFMSFLAIPTQIHEWKARDIAKQRLKEAGLWPQLPQDGAALDICLKAMPWCRVAGFRRVLPR